MYTKTNYYAAIQQSIITAGLSWRKSSTSNHSAPNQTNRNVTFKQLHLLGMEIMNTIAKALKCMSYR